MYPSNSNTAVFYHTTVYDCQVQACKEVFKEKLPSGLPPIAEPFNERPLYDISGCDAHQVVAVLSAIVNYKDQFTMNKTFYLVIRGSSMHTSQGFEELFRLTARPTEDQPGNAIVFLRLRGKKRFDRTAKSYEEFNGNLRAIYDVYITDRFFTQTQQLSQGILSNSFRTTQRLIILSNLPLKPTCSSCLRSLGA